jgi:hypothetical protein
MNGDLTKIEDIVPIVRFLAIEGWWTTGQTIFAKGGLYYALILSVSQAGRTANLPFAICDAVAASFFEYERGVHG